MGRRKTGYIFAPNQARQHRGVGCFWLVLALLLVAAALVILVNVSAAGHVALETQKVPVMGLDKTFERYTILHLSDLNASSLGEDADVWRTALYGKSYSAVVMTGDMVGKSGDYGPMVALIKILRGINTAAPIYFVAGDDDPEPYYKSAHGSPVVMAEWVLAAQDAGAVYLDAPMSLEAGKRKVWLVPADLYFGMDAQGSRDTYARQIAEMEAEGVQYDAEGGARYRARQYQLDVMDRTLAAIAEVTSADLQIAVVHVPQDTDYIRTTLSWVSDSSEAFCLRNVSLLMAGHYAGGQWRLPGGGAIYVPERGFFPSDEGLRGMQRVNSISQYISPGLGASGYYSLPGRMFNAPTATLLQFTAQIQ